MSQRTDQFGAQVHQALTTIMSHTIELPESVLVTVTHVDVSPDLKNADVFLTVIPDNKRGTALEIIRKQAGELRTELSHALYARVVPRLHFKIDDDEVYAESLSSLFHDIQEDLE
jgi:ribosome-binding factor A